MEISLAGAEGRNAVYWRSRAQESREMAKRMIGNAPRRGMLEIAKVYESLATLRDLDRRSQRAGNVPGGPRTVTVTSATEPLASSLQSTRCQTAGCS
jgi:hypothetical protein